MSDLDDSKFEEQEEMDATIEAELELDRQLIEEKRTKKKKVYQGEKPKTSVGRKIFTAFKWILFLGALITMAVAYLIPVAYFKEHYYPTTVINGHDCSEQDVEYAEQQIGEYVDNYSLTITGRNGLSVTITPEQIGLEYALKGETQRILEDQNAFAWLTEVGKRHVYDIDKAFTYDDELLAAVVESLPFYDEANIVVPEDAYLKDYDEETGRYEVIACVEGSLLKEDSLIPYIDEAIQNYRTELDLEELDFYRSPEVHTDDVFLNRAADTLNRYYETEIVYQFGENTEVVDRTVLRDWISLDWDTYEVTLDEEKVAEFISGLAAKYNTYGTKRTFITHDGLELTLRGKGVGWKINEEESVTELISMIQSGTKTTTEPVYLHTFGGFGEVNDLGSTYVEINLTQQHLWVWQDGEVTIDCNVVSGCVAKGNTTPAGIFQVYKMSYDTVLKGTQDGESWESPVTYWMPFNGSIGMHDASWRRKFGGDIYLTNGSHGCVNLPKKKAKLVWEMCYVGLPVVVYYEPEVVTEDTTVTDATAVTP